MIIACPHCDVKQNIGMEQSEIDDSVLARCLSCDSVFEVDAAGRATKPEFCIPVGGEQEEYSLKQSIKSRIASGEVDLPSTPELVDKLSRISADMDEKDIVALITSSPVGTARVIRAANSDFYHDLARVDSVGSAIGRIGLEKVCEVAAREHSAEHDDPRFASQLQALVSHSVASADAAREVARSIRYTKVEAAFLAGLTHDIGKICVANAVRDLANARDGGLPITDLLIEEMLSSLYADIGSHLASAWNFPEEVIEAIKLQGSEDQAPERFKLVWIVLAADVIVRKLNYNDCRAESVTTISNLLPMQVLRLTDLQIADIIITLEDQGVGEDGQKAVSG